jgi:site-specific DNA recombinase
MEIQKRVGIWIRVSTDMQVKDESPEHHERRGRGYAEVKGWEVVEVYRLEAVSGKAVMHHPEAKRMLSDIKSGHITGLIFSKLARLARNTKELLDFAEIFREYGADLISLAEAIDTSTPAGRLFYTMIAAMAAWEREEISERVAASVPIRAKMGKPLGGAASYGYQWKGKELLVDENEAPVRKLMYELFIKYRRKKTVANELNSRGHRTRNGSMFTGTTIDRLIKDPTAKGQRIANYTKSLGEGKNWVIKPKEEWVIMPCDPVVSETVWDEANQILESQTKKRQKPGRQAVHLLSGFVTCTCGKKMYVFHEAPTYACKACKNRVGVEDLDEIYHIQLKSFLLTDLDISSYMQQSDEALKEKERLLEHSAAEFQKLSKRMTEFVNLKVDGHLTKEAFVKEYKPLEERYFQLEKQLPELEAEVDFLRIHNLSSDVVFQDAKNLHERWPTLPFEEKRSIIEIITEGVTVGKSDISISFAYFPSPHPSFEKSGNRAHSLMGSCWRST